MDYTKEIAENLLETLLTPLYPGLIYEYEVKIIPSDPSDEDNNVDIQVSVIMNFDEYHELNYEKDIERELEKQIINILRYITTDSVFVIFYVIKD